MLLFYSFFNSLHAAVIVVIRLLLHDHYFHLNNLTHPSFIYSFSPAAFNSCNDDNFSLSFWIQVITQRMHNHPLFTSLTSHTVMHQKESKATTITNKNVMIVENLGNAHIWWEKWKNVVAIFHAGDERNFSMRGHSKIILCYDKFRIVHALKFFFCLGWKFSNDLKLFFPIDFSTLAHRVLFNGFFCFWIFFAHTQKCSLCDRDCHNPIGFTACALSQL